MTLSPWALWVHLSWFCPSFLYSSPATFCLYSQLSNLPSVMGRPPRMLCIAKLGLGPSTSMSETPLNRMIACQGEAGTRPFSPSDV